MMEFVEFTAERSAEECDSRLLKFDDFDFQQTYSFGELGRTSPYEGFRASLMQGDRALVMAQGLLRRTLFGGRILVIRGGPVYRHGNNEDSNRKHLRDFLQHLLRINKQRNRLFYLNVVMHSERSVATEIALREAGMTRPYFERSPYLTYVVPIHRDADHNLTAFDAKWRNQLRRAGGQEPVFN